MLEYQNSDEMKVEQKKVEFVGPNANVGPAYMLVSECMRLVCLQYINMHNNRAKASMFLLKFYSVYHVIIHKLEFLEHCVQWPNLVSQACFNN